MARVFVLGATGGVGSHLVRHLTAKDDEVVALHRSSGQAEQLSADALPVLGI
ncbi:NAD(P)H-binding protein [Streptomyces sp. NPDC050315]|uniref:NAD(P)H-binding protein n=1 Tax=Streptomyces sp. NPDC050315 TaxID=3155039 RepID=UPI003435A4F4